MKSVFDKAALHELVIIDCRFALQQVRCPSRNDRRKSAGNQQQEKKPGSQSPA
jgi:hypothetical protein